MLCASYSGGTEETLACFEAAGAAGTGRVVLTTGGALAGAAREEGVPVIGVPAGMPPRAAVLYMTIGALECAAACGAAPEVRSEIEGATALLERLVDAWGPDSEPDSLAKSIARSLEGTLPVIHGAGPTAAVARRWATQLHENAKLAAFASELPEADHNEICGWERGRQIAPLSAVFLEDADHHPARAQARGPDRRGGRAGGRAGRARPLAGREPARARALAGPARRPRERLPGGARRRRSHAHRGPGPDKGKPR